MFMNLDKSCTIANISSNNGWDNSLSSPVTVKCKYHLDKQIGSDGQSVILTGWAVVPANTTLTINSQFTFEGNLTPTIKNIVNVSDLKRNILRGYKVEFG
jgi:hypothetical protein